MRSVLDIYTQHIQVLSKHSIKGIPFNLGTVEVPKLSFVKKSFSI